VHAERPQREDPREDETKTLADVLYGRKTRVPVPESHWVALVRAIAEGDQQALHALFTESHRIVFTLIVRITGNRATAEELTLDVFHDVWRRASTYEPAAGSVVGWIMNQAQSRAIDRLRYETRKKRVTPELDSVDVPTTAHGPQEAFDAREQGHLLQQALQVLTPGEREAIETAFFSELTYSETATRLNQPLGTVKTRIRSGLGKLRQVLDETAGDG